MKHPMQKFDLKQVKVHHTLESSLIETACVLMLVATWALTWRQWHGTDVLENKMIVTVAVTVVTVFLLVCAYSPSYLGWSFPLHNIQAVGKAVRAMRLWALAGITTTVISLAGWGTMKPGLIVFLGCGLVLKAIATIIEIKEKDKKEDP